MHNKVNDLLYSILPTDKYLTFGEGNTNIVLSSPHGGGIKPISIPNRKYGTKLQDTYTRRLIESLVKKFDTKPYYIYSDIHRCKIDLNRDIREGCQGNKKAEIIWGEWNRILSFYTDRAKTYTGKCLYVDIHSHNNNDKIQLGYNLNAKDYVSLFINGHTTAPTTLDSFGTDKYDLIFGRKSFKATFEFHGYKTLMPAPTDIYFNGGRDIEMFSSNGIGAIQVELPTSILSKRLEDVVDTLYTTISVFTGWIKTKKP